MHSNKLSLKYSDSSKTCKYTVLALQTNKNVFEIIFYNPHILSIIYCKVHLYVIPNNYKCLALLLKWENQVSSCIVILIT